jgi:hypothetical protein
MAPIPQLLDEMRGRLGMFLGSSSLPKLAAFLRGYEHAIVTSDKSDPFLADFRDWIQQRLNDTSRSWEDAIVSRSKGEADAVRQFWELLDEYRSEQRKTEEQRLATTAGAPCH